MSLHSPGPGQSQWVWLQQTKGNTQKNKKEQSNQNRFLRDCNVKAKEHSCFGHVTISLRDQRRLSKGCCSFHVEGSSPSTWSEATTQVPSASQEYVPLSSADTRLMYKRATFQSCSTTILRPSGCNGCPSFFHWALTGLEYWQMNSAGWFSTTRRFSISLTTSTVGSEVGVRGHSVRALSITYKDKSRTCQLTCGLYNPQNHFEMMHVCDTVFEDWAA